MCERRTRWLGPAAILLALGFLSAGGCAKAPEITNAFQDEQLGIAFDFPPGWSELTAKEWRERKMGKNRTRLTIMDDQRKAGFSVIVADLDMESEITSMLLGSDPAPRTAMLLESVDRAGPQQYKGYKLLEKGPTLFAGLPFGHIVYQGQQRGKEMRWWRMIVALPPQRTDVAVMIVSSVTLEMQSEYQAAFQQIEDSWRWLGKDDGAAGE